MADNKGTVTYEGLGEPVEEIPPNVIADMLGQDHRGKINELIQRVNLIAEILDEMIKPVEERNIKISYKSSKTGA